MSAARLSMRGIFIIVLPLVMSLRYWHWPCELRATEWRGLV